MKPTFKENDLVILLKDYPPNMYDICDDLLKILKKVLFFYN